MTQETTVQQARNDRPLPEVGSTWRARRKGETARTVRVVEVEPAHGFITTETLTTTWGDAPRKPTRSRLRATRFHYEFDPADA